MSVFNNLFPKWEGVCPNSDLLSGLLDLHMKIPLDIITAKEFLSSSNGRIFDGMYPTRLIKLDERAGKDCPKADLSTIAVIGLPRSSNSLLRKLASVQDKRSFSLASIDTVKMRDEAMSKDTVDVNQVSKHFTVNGVVNIPLLTAFLNKAKEEGKQIIYLNTEMDTDVIDGYLSKMSEHVVAKETTISEDVKVSDVINHDAESMYHLAIEKQV